MKDEGKKIYFTGSKIFDKILSEGYISYESCAKLQVLPYMLRVHLAGDRKVWILWAVAWV